MRSQQSNDDLVIVGAGIGGLALAIALSRIGRPFKIYEQAERFARVGTGIQMTPNAMKVLRRLGLEPMLREIAFDARFRVTRQWDTGEELLRIPMGKEMERLYGAPHLLLHRGDLHQALYESIPRDSVVFGAKLERAEVSTRSVHLLFADGREVEASHVVAADGVHSAARSSLFSEASPRFTGEIAYRAVYDAELLASPLIDDKSKWRGTDRQISIYYISQGREVYFTSQVPSATEAPESFALEGDLQELRDAFTGFHPEVRKVLEACPRVQKWAIFDRDPLPGWQVGRLVLLGDAAHPMTPAMAQGAAMALEDAAVLARCIEEADDSNLTTAFQRYVATRISRASEVQIESSRDRWNWTRAGSTESDAISIEDVYSFDAWEVPLASSAAV